jgi:hypothetical protein
MYIKKVMWERLLADVTCKYGAVLLPAQGR